MWPVTDSLMWSLGKFAPRRPDPDPNDVRLQFTTFVTKRVTNLSRWEVEVRPPGWLYINRHTISDVRRWHRDGSQYWGEAHYMALWSSTHGTEIIDPQTGQIYQETNAQVLLISNQYFRHRVPTEITRAADADRWFARARFPTTAQVHPVRGVARLTLDTRSNRV